MEYFLIWLVGSIFIFVGLYFFLTRHENKVYQQKFDAAYQHAEQALNEAKKRYQTNMSQLKQLDFVIEQQKQLAGRYFYFDYTHRMIAFENHWFDDSHHRLTPKSPTLPLGAAFCSAITVFHDDKLIDCVLLQDGSVVKNSSGSAQLKGTSIPYFGKLEGVAESGTNEHQTGILAVRITLDDIQTPSIVFNITSGSDKSTAEYGSAFANAQELYGLFDSIVQLNLRAKTPKPAETADPLSSDLTVKLRQLKVLKEEGLLTEAEYQLKRESLLKDL